MNEVHSRAGDDRRVVETPARRGQTRGAILLAAALAMAAAACGGGGGGGSGGGPSPIPTVPVLTPTPQPAATPTPTPLRSDVSLILKQGDRLSGGIEVGDINDAALASDASVAAIVTAAGKDGAQAVVERSPGGDFTTVFGPDDAAPGLDLSTLARPRIAPGGHVLFEAGSGLDMDRLYLASGGVTQALAGAAPGVVAPTFRILGESSLGQNGLVGFVGGGSPCTVTMQGQSVRVRCDVHLQVADGFSVSQVSVPDVDLTNLNPNTPQVKMADSGAVFFSIPGAGTSPTLVRYADGRLRVLLTADQELDPVGAIIRPQLNAVNGAEDLLVTTTLQSDPGPSRPTVIGIVRGNDFTTIAKEDRGTGPDSVTALRSLGLDDQGRAVFTATLGTADSPDGTRQSLRVSDGESLVEIATEGGPFPGTDLTLLTIASARMNRRGDVAFTAELGRKTPGTVIVEEVRAVKRLADGSLSAPVTSLDGGQAGTISLLRIPALGDDGSMLVLARADQSGNRVLLLAAPPGP